MTPHLLSLSVALGVLVIACGAPTISPEPSPGLGPLHRIYASIDAAHPPRPLLPPMSPSAIALRRRLATALMGEGEWRAAHDHWHRLSEEHPDNTRIVLGFAESLFMMGGDLKRSRTLLERVVKEAPESASALVLLAQLQEGEGEQAQAEVHYRKAVALAPDDDRPYQGLVRILQRARRHDEALSFLDVLLQRHSEDVPTLIKLARSLEAVGRIEEAEARWLEVSRRHPDPIRGKMQLFQHYKRRGNTARATVLARELNELRQKQQSKRRLRPLLPSRR